jgi:hypothetical protein
MKRLALITASLFTAAAFAAVGCSTGDDSADSDESHLEGAGPEVEACKIFDVPTQKFIDLQAFANDPQHPERKNDPVLQKILAPVLQGKSCPKNFLEIQTTVDGLKGCTKETRVISERSMLTKKPDVGRALASHQCAGSNDPNVFLLVDPIHTGSADVPSMKDASGKTPKQSDVIPTDVELLANNTVDGIFSYYAREPVAGPRDSFDQDADQTKRLKEPMIWKFYGTSVDFVSNGYDCDVSKFHGACQSRWAQDNGVKGNTSGARCASCHPGGGMVQKELNSPWTYWQDDPGGYTQKHKDVYGSFQPGVSYEGVTTTQNTRWAKKRVDVLAKKSVKDLLRPVFCTMDINLQAGEGGAHRDFFVDPQFNSGAPSINFDPASYTAALTALAQDVMQEDPNDENKRISFSPKISDTPDTFMYPERSQLDQAYVAALIASGKVTADLVRDILFVDFTRPIFSPTRCGLVDLADGITDSTKAKDELIKKLTAKSPAAGTAEKEFLDSLQVASEPAPAARHQNAITAYGTACTARATSDKAGIALDAVTYASHLRQVARLMKVDLKVEQGPLGILDFKETVPYTNQSDGPVKEMKFDPTTCILSK